MKIMPSMLFRKLSLVIIAVSLMSLAGCSVFMATKQPDYKDLSVLDVGGDRSNVVAELGAPVLAEEREGKKVDVFVFKQDTAIFVCHFQDRHRLHS